MKTELDPDGTIEAVRYFTNDGACWKFENGKMIVICGDEWCDSVFKCPNELFKEGTGVREITEKEALEIMAKFQKEQPSTKPENQPSKWNRFGEVKREIGRPIWAWDGKRIGQFEGTGGDIEFTVTGWTHWQYAELPEPPTVNQDEEEFERQFGGLHDGFNKPMRRIVWFAALNYARKEKKQLTTNKPTG